MPKVSESLDELDDPKKLAILDSRDFLLTVLDEDGNPDDSVGMEWNQELYDERYEFVESEFKAFIKDADIIKISATSNRWDGARTSDMYVSIKSIEEIISKDIQFKNPDDIIIEVLDNGLTEIQLLHHDGRNHYTLEPICFSSSTKKDLINIINSLNTDYSWEVLEIMDHDELSNIILENI